MRRLNAQGNWMRPVWRLSDWGQAGPAMEAFRFFCFEAPESIIDHDGEAMEGQMPYRDRSEYRPPPRRIARINRVVARLAGLGLTPGNTVALEVPGRRSGQVRRTSLVVAEHGSNRYLVSLAGESEWVRNVRANNYRASLRRAARAGAATGTEGVSVQARLLEVA
jgi:hypothetical protein